MTQPVVLARLPTTSHVSLCQCTWSSWCFGIQDKRWGKILLEHSCFTFLFILPCFVSVFRAGGCFIIMTHDILKWALRWDLRQQSDDNQYWHLLTWWPWLGCDGWLCSGVDNIVSETGEGGCQHTCSCTSHPDYWVSCPDSDMVSTRLDVLQTTSQHPSETTMKIFSERRNRYKI